MDGDDHTSPEPDRGLTFGEGLELFGKLRLEHLQARVLKNVLGIQSAPVRVAQRYIATRPVGAGGMGTVWAAFDTKLERRVALKILNETSRSSPELANRLEREAKALAQLSHRNVVTVYEAGEHDGAMYIAMEYIDGPNLADYCRELPWPRVLDAYLAAGHGLAAAHAARIVHRDFKPQNVMVGSDGNPRVLDFGLARGMAEQMSMHSSTTTAAASRSMSLANPLTRDGAVVGTAAYMAPEQARGEPSDEKSDQFSFCVALYEALYGERPYAGRTLPVLLDAVMAGRVRPAPGRRRVPKRIRRALVKGLAGDPDARHPSMAALLEQLERDPRKWALGLSSAALGLAGIAFASLSWDAQRLGPGKVFERAASIVASHEAVQDAEQQALTRGEDQLTMRLVDSELARDPTHALALLASLSAGAPAWDHDARIVAAAAAHLGVAREVRILPTDRAPHGMSPDARWVAARYAANGATDLIDLASGASRLLAPSGIAASLVAFSPDGTQVAAIRDPLTLGIWSTADGTYRALATVPVDHQFIVFSPDGERVLTHGRDGDIHVFDVATGGRQVLAGHGDAVSSARISPDGTEVVSFDAYGILRRWSLATGSAVTMAARSPFAFMPDGAVVAAKSTSDVEIFRTGAASVVLTGFTEPLEQLAVSEDGSRIVAADATGGVWWWDVATSAVHRLPGHDEAVTDVGFVGGTRWVVSASIDKTLGLFDTESTFARHLRGHRGVQSWAFDPKAAQIVTVGWDGEIRRWDLPQPTERPAPEHPAKISAIAYGPDTIAIGGQDGHVREWDGASWSVVLDHPTALATIVYSDDGRVLASGDTSGGVRIRDARGVRSLPTAGAVVGSLALSDDGTTLVAAQEADGLAVYDLGASTVRVLATAPFKPRWVDLDSTEDVITAVGWVRDRGFSIRTFALATGDAHSEHDLAERVTAAAFTPDRSAVAYGSADRGVHVWTRADETSRRLGERDHAGLVFGVDFSPDGSMLASASADGTVRLWDLASGRDRVVDLRHRDLKTVVFSPDGNTFAAGGGDALLYLGRDDLPRDRAGLVAWLGRATDYTLDKAARRDDRR